MPLELLHDRVVVLIRQSAFERAGMTRQAMDERYNLTDDEFRVEDGLIAVGPLPSDELLPELIDDLEASGLIYFDDGLSPRSVAGQISGANNAAFAKADAVLDAVPTQADIDNALARLEATARSRGVAVASASALPITIDRIALWARGAEDRGIVLVPLTSVAVRPKTAT